MRQLLKCSQFAVGLVAAFRKIRPDLAAWRGCRARKKIIAAYLAGTTMRKLQIGGVEAVRTGVSASPELCGLEHHAQAVGAKLDEFETMIFEAARPA